MPAAQFDPELRIDSTRREVTATGKLDLAAGEKEMIICIRIYQGGVVVAECDVDHPFRVENGRWSMPAEFVGTAEPAPGPAIAAAVAVTVGPTPGQMNSYQWTQPLALKL